eukprot:583115-Hanusia_phi.AAC.3
MDGSAESSKRKRTEEEEEEREAEKCQAPGDTSAVKDRKDETKLVQREEKDQSDEIDRREVEGLPFRLILIPWQEARKDVERYLAPIRYPVSWYVLALIPRCCCRREHKIVRKAAPESEKIDPADGSSTVPEVGCSEQRRNHCSQVEKSPAYYRSWHENDDRKARKEADRQSKRQKQGKGQNKNRGEQKSGLNQKVSEADASRLEHTLTNLQVMSILPHLCKKISLGSEARMIFLHLQPLTAPCSARSDPLANSRTMSRYAREHRRMNRLLLWHQRNSLRNVTNSTNCRKSSMQTYRRLISHTAIREQWVEHIKNKPTSSVETKIVNMEEFEKNMLPRDLQAKLREVTDRGKYDWKKWKVEARE